METAKFPICLFVERERWKLKKPGYESLPKDATFIDITPYINKDYVLRFNKGGLVERPTK